MKKLQAQRLPELLDFLAGSMNVFAPVTEDGLTLLKRWSGQELAQEYINPENSLKDILYPQTEEIMAFRGGYDDLSISPAAPPSRQLVWGTRPCDAVALAKTARVFEEGEFTDENYRALRAATTIVTAACSRSGPHCFCRAVEVSPADARGSDVMVYPQADELLLEAVTDKGEKLLADIGEFLSEATSEEGQRARRRCDETTVEHDEATGTALSQDVFENPYWESLATRCLSCGICTYICPTCYCFTLFDRVRGKEGKRLRGWDSCQFEDFAVMAGGHNPRPSVKERIRQRFMHKLSYFPARYGELHCVGCGRCVAKCPVGLHILGVITDVEEVV